MRLYTCQWQDKSQQAMKLYNYYLGEPFSIRIEIDKLLMKHGEKSLTPIQQEAIEQVLSTKRILYKIEEKKVSPLWRLTAPMFFLVSILFAITMPVKWLITGSYYYDFDDKPIRFMKKWKMKLMN